MCAIYVFIWQSTVTLKSSYVVFNLNLCLFCFSSSSREFSKRLFQQRCPLFDPFGAIFFLDSPVLLALLYMGQPP